MNDRVVEMIAEKSLLRAETKHFKSNTIIAIKNLGCRLFNFIQPRARATFPNC